MARNSFGRNALHSYRSEQALIRSHNAQALTFKYMARFGHADERHDALLGIENWFIPRPDPTPDYRREKFFDGMTLESGRKSPIMARDEAADEAIFMGQVRMSHMHVLSIAGPNHLRTQFGAIADYIAGIDPLLDIDYVGGVTYKEMGRLVMRLGLREMQITAIDQEYETLLRASYMAYCAINAKQGDLEPMAVYLPTADFVHQFGTPSA